MKKDIFRLEMRNFKTWTLLLVCVMFLNGVKATAQSAPGTHGKIYCNTLEEIIAAMKIAEPGDEIIIAAGDYTGAKKTQEPDIRGKWARFVGIGNGDAANPIIIRGASSTNRPVLQGPAGRYDGYTMRIVGDFWIIKDLIITEGSKGVVLDKSNYCEINNVKVHQVAEEGIHFRDGSSNNIATHCEVINTGIIKPEYGEGFYVGSDKAQHDLTGTTDDYNPYCFDNTIEYCKVGPQVAAEGVDIKEGTKNTIVRHCEFSAVGISGENSADAFIDLKGAYAFIHNNTFNVDGSSIIAAGIDILDRGTNDNTGYRNAIFDNTFNLGSGNAAIPSVRFKQGSPVETHFWGNTRIPESPEPNGYWTKDIISSCPSWNIVSCDGGEPVNRAPSIHISSPSHGDVFVIGTNITISVNSTDPDGTVTKVEFYKNGTLLGTDNSAPFNHTINNASNGTYLLTAKAFDNDNASTLSTVISISVEPAVSSESPYAFGIIPSNIKVSDAQTAYTVLMNKFYEDCGNGKGRIRWGLSSNSWEKPGETVSEGIAYGMLLAAYYNDKTHFDGLWNYYKSFLNANGFMHWHTQGCSTVLGNDGATDSDVDAAMALIVADKVFGSSGTINYSTEAKSMIAAIKVHEVEAVTYTLKPGDAFGGSEITNISYFATGAFKLFGKFTDDEVFWNKVVDQCYIIIDNNLNANDAVGGLVSDWCKADGTQASGKTLNYSYDACRTPWRIATDYIWFGDSRAKSYLDKTNNFVQNTINGIQNVNDGYQQNGSLIEGVRHHNVTFVGNFACAGVALNSQSQINKYYSEIENCPPVGYFDYFFDVFSRTMLCGLYENPLKGEVVNALNKESVQEIGIYPNPVNTGFFTISGLSDNNVEVVISDVLGNTRIRTVANNMENKINVEVLKSGTYILTVKTKNQRISKLFNKL